MNKSFIYVFTGLMLCGLAIAEYSGGDGSLGKPYEISEPNQLVAIVNNPFDFDKSYKLTADIDMSGVEFSPIGTVDTPFTGLFDGDGYTISSLSINVLGQHNIGLFGMVGNQGRVWNLNLDQISVVSQAGTNSGAIAGYNAGIIINSTVSNSTISGDDGAGGITGYNEGGIRYCTIDNVSVYGNGIGGITGYNQRGDIYACDVLSATIVGGDVAGGIAGSLDNVSSLDNCTCNADVSGGEYIGGVAGINQYSSISRVTGSGTVNGTDSTGGLVGYNTGDISDSTTTASVAGVINVGGIAGYLQSGRIYNTTFFGPEPTGEENVGKFIGSNVGDGFEIAQTEYSYADLNTDGNVDAEDLIILAANWLMTEEMLEETETLQGDINTDGVVNFGDFSELANEWLTSIEQEPVEEV